MEPSQSSGPLAGLKVLELGQLIAGPFAAKTLGDFGAEVVKVEPPGTGDPLRKWRLLKNGTSVWWQVQSRNKRSVALDLKDPQAQEIVRKLASEADVLIENFRPGALEGWGLGPDRLLERNPRLIMLRVSGYGQTGPYRDRPGFGVVGEAMGGLRHLTAEPGRVPVRVGISIGDTLAALHGVIGILVALQERQRSGQGQVIDVALYEAVFNCMGSLLPGAGRSLGAGRADLHRGRYRRRPALPGPRHAAVTAHRRRRHAGGARRGAQALAHARRPPPQCAAHRAGYRSGAARSRHQRRTDRRAAQPRCHRHLKTKSGSD